MELTNFGAVMKFALDRENDIRTILDAANKNEKLSGLRSRLELFVTQNTANIKTLERTRREGINEVVLHPIVGLSDNNYLFTITSVSDVSEQDFLRIISGMSENLSLFYSEAAGRLHTDDAKRVFQKLARKKYI